MARSDFLLLQPRSPVWVDTTRSRLDPCIAVTNQENVLIDMPTGQSEEGDSVTEVSIPRRL